MSVNSSKTPTGMNGIEMPKSAPAPLPEPKESACSDEEIKASTNYIYEQLRLLQADDIAQLGTVRQVQGESPLSVRIAYWKLVAFNVKRYLQYLWDTWSVIPIGVFTGQLDTPEAIAVFFWAAWTSSSLFMIFVWCTFATAPLVVWLYNKIAGPSSNGLSLVNSSNPHLFECLNQEQANAGKTKLGAELDAEASHSPRIFDLDIAKVLLQISALVYERDTSAMSDAVDAAQRRAAIVAKSRKGAPDPPSSAKPGAILYSLLPEADAKFLLATLEVQATAAEGPIKNFTDKYGMCFATASELQTTSEAYCSLFWDPKSNWIVVAFKGTDPTSFDEWTTDFTATFVDGSSQIPGFSYIHKGFKDRILPDGDEHNQPFTRIAEAVKITCEELVKGHPADTKINIWFTGHSLGTALASLAYAKALSHQDCFGPHAMIRDAYVFATPVTVDIKSRLYFDDLLRQDAPRTLFRVTNRDDFVATGVPQLGDNMLESFGADNMFNFSHLGVELYMKDSPLPSQIFGDAVRAPAGYKVVIRSIFDAKQTAKFRSQLVAKGWVQASIMGWAQYIPFAGRLAAHGTTNYWEQIERIAQLPCVEKA